MPGTNTFAGAYNFPAIQNIGTTETVLPTPISSPALAFGSSFVAGVRPEVAASGGVIEGHTIRLKAAGRVSPAVSTTFALRAYYLGATVTNPATVPPSANLLAAFPSAPTLAAATLFGLSVEFMWDSKAQLISGFYEMFAGSTLVARTPLINTVSSVLVAANLSFVLSVQFGTGNASNAVTFSEVVLEQG